MVLEQLRQYVSIKDIAVFTHVHPQNQTLLAYLKYDSITTFTEPVNDCLSVLSDFKANALISMCYRRIVSPEVLDLVRHRAINYHPSMLPGYRGVFSVPWSLINGESKTGVTWHYMTEKVDEGKIVAQAPVPIETTDTAFNLYHKCLSKGTELFHQAWNHAVVNQSPGQEQRGEASYYSRKLPHGGVIDPGWPEDKIERFIRAMWFPPFEPAMIETSDGPVYFKTMEEYVEWRRIG